MSFALSLAALAGCETTTSCSEALLLTVMPLPEAARRHG